MNNIQFMQQAGIYAIYKHYQHAVDKCKVRKFFTCTLLKTLIKASKSIRKKSVY